MEVTFYNLYNSKLSKKLEKERNVKIKRTYFDLPLAGEGLGYLRYLATSIGVL
jgi:hypothetical protein